ncbi:ATP-binding protein [Pyrinomonas methylaliphatogenes]|uniref:histidine kinase n=1 Tax=Pyrinomonas methylaliphatogenes TaxID=454194 RepID=A0A0B6WYG1_9BACT|nr:CHASE3 domain-containing protein [Pyrinomonas methylaliphatogenes]MBX5477789.1 CHASE3 domain-containing protein [Pyrinomonas methylaliphatogenes]CDM66308.1 PAS domain S-box [Pyrinomonas methylaliphatogenes]
MGGKIDERRLKRTLTWAVIIPFLSMAFLAVVLVWQIERLNADMRWVDHSNQIVAQARYVERLVVDMETGVRGYLITGSPEFLEPYTRAEAMIDQEIEELARLVAVDPERERQVDDVRDAEKRWHDLAAQLIALREEGRGADLDRALIQGKAIVDSVRERLLSLVESESAARRARLEELRGTGQSVIFSAVALMLLWAGILAIFTRRELLAISRSYAAALASSREVEERYRLLVEEARDYAIYMLDADGRVASWNRGAERLFGYGAEEIVGKHFSLLFTPEDVAQRVPHAELQRAANDGYAEHTGWRVRKDGSRFWATGVVTPVRDPDGKLRGYVKLTRDATAQLRAEEERALRLAYEERRVEQLRQLADLSVLINVSRSLDEMLKTLTERARAIIGAHQAVASLTIDDNWAQAINAVSLSDKYAAWRDYDAQPDGSGIYSLVCRTNQPMRLTQEELERHPAWRGFGKEAGKHPPLRGWLAAPLIGRNGQNLGLIQLSDKYEGEFTAEDEALLMQIAQIASVAIENHRLYQLSEENNRLKDEFLATLSHELRTPMTAILGWMHLLREGKLDEAATSRALDAIYRNAQAQMRLIEDLLDISRIITGKFQFEVMPIGLVPVIESALDSIKPAAEAKRIDIETRLDESAGPVMGNPDRLRQAIWNLLSNAVKFTPRGGRVTVELRRVDSHVEIRISDTGEGISPEFLPFVFERLRQADSSTRRTHGGLGIGLSIVRHIVELHGGRVGAESQGKGRGATFFIQLPLLALQVSKGERWRSVERENGPGEPQGDDLSLDGVRILVIDDDQDTREMIAEVLGRYGARVETVATAAEALRAVDWQPVDLIISDIGMPEEDGYDLIRRLHERGLGIPAVALTAYVREADRDQALASGFQAHIAKPVSPEDLVRAIRSLMLKLQGQ